MRSLIKVVVLAGVVALVGCTTAPIMNVNQAAVASSSGKPLTNEQVRSSIVRAGAALGWQMKDVDANTLMATISLRKHTAVVEIPYTPTAYSIKYKSSIELGENNGTIHKNYNGWIQNLTKGINAQLSSS